jgi:hypothetical protein
VFVEQTNEKFRRCTFFGVSKIRLDPNSQLEVLFLSDKQSGSCSGNRELRIRFQNIAGRPDVEHSPLFPELPLSSLLLQRSALPMFLISKKLHSHSRLAESLALISVESARDKP